MENFDASDDFLNSKKYTIDEMFDFFEPPIPKYDYLKLSEVIEDMTAIYDKDMNIKMSEFMNGFKMKLRNHVQRIIEEQEKAEEEINAENEKSNMVDGGNDGNTTNQDSDINGDMNTNTNTNTIMDPTNSYILGRSKTERDEINTHLQLIQGTMDDDDDNNNDTNMIEDDQERQMGGNNAMQTSDMLVRENKSLMSDNTKSASKLLMKSGLNPKTEDIIEKTLVFNSEFRKQNDPINDYLIDLAEPLQQVMSIKLNTYTLSYNIYNIDEMFNTNVLYITDNTNTEHKISIKSGLYLNVQSVLSEVNSSVLSYFTDLSNAATSENDPNSLFGDNPQQISMSYDSISGRVTMNSVKRYEEYTDTNSRFPIFVSFFSFAENNAIKFNFNLGYFLGFRKRFVDSNQGVGYYLEATTSSGRSPTTDVDNTALDNIFTTVDSSFNSVISEGLPDLNHPKYLIISLDEFNQNRPNTDVMQANDGTNNIVYEKIAEVDIPRNPRQRTLASLYAQNERVVTNRNELAVQRIRNYPQTIPDTFAMIDFPSELRFGINLNNQGQNVLSIPERKYFGPVNINRFRVRLFDDKGNLVNLNNTDYTFSVKMKMLYNPTYLKKN